MDMMGKKRDMLEGLGCDEEIENLGEPHIPFNPSPEHTNEKCHMLPFYCASDRYS